MGHTSARVTPVPPFVAPAGTLGLVFFTSPCVSVSLPGWLHKPITVDCLHLFPIVCRLYFASPTLTCLFTLMLHRAVGPFSSGSYLLFLLACSATQTSVVLILVLSDLVCFGVVFCLINTHLDSCTCVRLSCV